MGTDDNFIFGLGPIQEHFTRLGWEFYVFRKSEVDTRGTSRHGLRYYASWGSSIGGEQWIDDLVSSGKAQLISNNGLFQSFALPASEIREILRNGPPCHKGPPVIGDNYVMSSGWIGDSKIDWDGLLALDPNEIMLVDMVDQS